MKKKCAISITSMVFTLLVCTTSVSADIAPPLQPPGANPGPPEFVETMVEMGIEQVNIRVRGSSDLYYMDHPFETVDASVSATFLMYNLGTAAETLEVLFPLTNMEGMGDGHFNNPEIQNLSISVDSQPVAWEELSIPNPRGEDDPSIKWAQFTVEFPVEEVVFIDVSYDVQSTGYFPEATFYYVLETGGGWYGPIQNADIFLHLPYEASAENVLFGDHNMMPFDGKTVADGEFEGNKVHWSYEDIEPERGDNWAATIIAPHIWEKILELRAEMDAGERGAPSKITKWYDALIIERTIRPGTEDLIPLNHEAYQKALTIDPTDDEMLARYANFQLFLYDHGHPSVDRPEILDEIYYMASEALKLNTFNDTAPQVISWLENTYDYVPLEEETAKESQEMEEPAIEKKDTQSTDIEHDDMDDSERDQRDYIVYLLGGGLAVALIVVIFLASKLKKKKTSN